MTWLFFAIIAHFLNAIVFVVDKYILSRAHFKPEAYAFYVGLLGGSIALILMPFGFSPIPLNQILISFLAGALFIAGVLFFYKSIEKEEVSKITPIIGGAVPFFTLVLTYLFLDERLSFEQLIAFTLLVLGGMIIIWPRKNISSFNQIRLSFLKKLPKALLSAFFFAFSYVLTKYIFSYQPFINGFIWIRVGGLVGAGIIFFLPTSRGIIFRSSNRIKFKTGVLAVLNKILSSGSFILLNYAIFLGSVSLVNALQGIQYVFLLILGIFLSRKFPQIIKEQVNQGAIIQKIIAIVFVIFGLVLLSF